VSRTRPRIHPKRARVRGPPVFLFFSNRLGCVGSLLISALVTIVLLILLGVL